MSDQRQIAKLGRSEDPLPCPEEIEIKHKAATTPSHSLKTTCQVVIYTPSNKWIPTGPPDEIRARSSTSDKLSAADETSSTTSAASTLMSDYGSLYDDKNEQESDDKEIPVYRKRRRSSPLNACSKSTCKPMYTLQTPKSECSLRKGSFDQPSPTPSARPRKIEEAQKKQPTTSPFFSPPPSTQKLKAKFGEKSRPKPGIVSCIPFPPLNANSFGLLQEKLAHDPFRLLIGVTFLNRTHGKYAIPVFFELMAKYPTAADLLASRRRDILAIIRHLGLQIKRTDTYIEYARLWTYDPPVKGRRYRVDHYPEHGDGMDIKKDEVVDDDDPRHAWEIGHITQGRYAIDSWRIFCRDVLRGKADGWNGEGREGEFQPEWMRVLPQDKELRAILRWMWLKEGYEWDPFTGGKEPASKKLQEAAIQGRIAWDNNGGMRLLDVVNEEDGIAMTEGTSASALKTLEALEKES